MNQPDSLPAFRARPAWWGTAPISLLADIQQLFRDSTDPMDELDFWNGLLEQITDLSELERADVEFYIVKSIAGADIPGVGLAELTTIHEKVWVELEIQFQWTKNQAWLKELLSQGDFTDQDQSFEKLMQPLTRVKGQVKAKLAKLATPQPSYSSPFTMEEVPRKPARPSFWEAKSAAKREAERKAMENPGISNLTILLILVAVVVLIAGYFAWAAGIISIF
jgi:hypothetical protein